MANCSSNKVLRNDGTSTCGQHKGVCAANAPLSFGVGVGTKITQAQLADLRAKIQAALNRCNSHPMYSTATSIANNVPAVSSSTTKISRNHLISPANALDTVWTENDTIGGTGQSPSPVDNRPRTKDRSSYGTTFVPVSWTLTANRNQGDVATAAQMIDIINSYNQLRQDCVCNTDCNCNSVCTCNNNCICNY